MTYTDSRQCDLRARFDAILYNASMLGGFGHFGRTMTMFGALIEGRDLATVTLAPLSESVSDKPGALAPVSKEEQRRLFRSADRIWELAQDDAHYDRIMAGLVRLSQY